MHRFGLNCHDMHHALNNPTMPLRVRIAGDGNLLPRILLNVWYVHRDAATGAILAGPVHCYTNAQLQLVQAGTTKTTNSVIAFDTHTGEFLFNPGNNPGVYEIMFHAWDGTTPPTAQNPNHCFHHPITVHAS